MEERELLELAALAAGYELTRMCDPVESGEEDHEFFHLNGRYWNPRNDDGDSMRLAVDAKISFGISKQTGRPLVCWFVNNELRKSEMHKDPDPPQYAASRVEWVRSAIFYAATDIGHHMRMLGKAKKEHATQSFRHLQNELHGLQGQIDTGMIIGIDPNYAICLKDGDYYGWLFKRHPDGQWVTARLAQPAELETAIVRQSTIKLILSMDEQLNT